MPKNQTLFKMIYTFSEFLQHFNINVLAYISSIFNQWFKVKVVFVQTQSSTLLNSRRNGMACILKHKFT